MPSKLKIRRANLSDLESIYQIEIECFYEDAFPLSYLKQFLKDPRFITLVAILENKIVGFIVGSIEFLRDKNVGHVYSIDVKPEYRRRGVGSCLLETIENILKKEGAEKCYLEVSVNNITAIKFYLKHGYKFLEVLGDYYGYGKDGIRLVKEMNN